MQKKKFKGMFYLAQNLLHKKQPTYLLLFLPWQGRDRYLWLMQGLFRANGGSGYVKKPDILLKVGPRDEVFDPSRSLPVLTTLKVVTNDLHLYSVLIIFFFILH